MKNKTLIFHQGSLGDLIVTLTALSSIRDFTHIDICCRPAFIPLLRHLTAAHQIYDIEQRCFISLFSGSPSDDLKRLFSDYQQILFFSYALEPVKSIKQITNCPVFLIPPRPDPHQRIHVVDFLIQWISRIFPETKDNVPPQFKPFFSQIDALSKEVLLHPGSGSIRKNWPIENFIRIDRYLRENGYQPKWVIGPAEKYYLKTLESHDIADNHVYPSLGLVDFAGALNRASGFIGNDSGLSHLAAFMGQRVITVFGPSDPKRWRPIGPKAVAVTPEVECSPCFEIEKENCRSMDCFNSFSVDKVIKTIKIHFSI